MKSRAAAPETSLAASIAAEDLRAGQDVAVLNETFEFPSFLWDCDSATTSRQDVVRVQCAARNSGTPLRIRAVCLPFVFVTAPNGERRVIDIRLAQLVRLDPGYARLVRKQLRNQQGRTAAAVGHKQRSTVSHRDARELSTMHADHWEFHF
jgi:hypothetical protein